MWQVMYEEGYPVEIDEGALFTELARGGHEADNLMNICVMNEGMWVRVEQGMLIRKEKE